jgi:antibiotic biosynthesis monooxygenase (ABM) superfamily enzyme
MVGAKYFAIALMDGIIVYWLYKRLQKKLIDKKWMKETDALF